MFVFKQLRRLFSGGSSPLHSPLLGVLLLAALLRLLGIATRPLWYDEAFSVLLAAKGPLSEGMVADVHPFGYYLSLALWMRLFGSGLWAVRSLSVVTGLGVVALAYGLGRELSAHRLGLWAALLLAISPFQVHYAQEVRMYALLALTCALATLALWKGMHTQRLRWWLLFGGSVLAAQLTHNLAVFYLLPLALTPLFRRDRRSSLRTALACLGAGLLYLPWLFWLWRQVSQISRAYWTQPPTLSRLFTTLLTFVTNLPLPDSWLPVGLFLTLTVVVLGFWQTLRAHRRGLHGAGVGLWLAYLAFAPAALLFLVSQWRPLYIERVLLPSGVMFVLWLSWVLLRTGMPPLMRSFTLACLLAAAVVGISQHLRYQGFPYAPFAQLGNSLESRLRPGDVVIHSNKLTMLPMVYYAPDLPQRYLADPPGSGADTLSPATQRVFGLMADPDLESATRDAPQRIWFVIFSRARQEYTSQGAPDHPHLLWLQRHYTLAAVEQWGDVSVFLFDRAYAVR